MGGLIAQEIAINYPERIRKLVLGSTWAFQDNESNGITPAMLAASALPPRQGFKLLLDAICNKWYYRFIVVPYIKFQLRKIKDPEIIGLLGQAECIKRHNSRDKLSSITAPTLVITGTGDKVVKPGSSITLSQLIPGAKLVTIANGSHAVCMEKSKVYNKEVLEFLQSD